MLLLSIYDVLMGENTRKAGVKWWDPTHWRKKHPSAVKAETNYMAIKPALVDLGSLEQVQKSSLEPRVTLNGIVRCFPLRQVPSLWVLQYPLVAQFSLSTGIGIETTAIGTFSSIGNLPVMGG
jgi:hypothetical protein